MSALALLMCCLAGAPAGPPDVPDLLQAVSRRYQRLTDYVIEVKRSSIARIVTADFARPFEMRYSIARSGSKLHFEVTQPHPGFVEITDGEQHWQYLPEVNEYRVDPAEPWPAIPGPGPGAPGRDWEYVAKFGAVAGLSSRAKVLNGHVEPDGVCPTATVLVELQVGDSREPRVDRLRIDPSTGLVCQAQITLWRRNGSTLGKQRIDLQWRYLQLSGPVDSALFAFTPPKHARRVKRFGRTSSAGDMSW